MISGLCIAILLACEEALDFSAADVAATAAGGGLPLSVLPLSVLDESLIASVGESLQPGPGGEAFLDDPPGGEDVPPGSATIPHIAAPAPVAGLAPEASGASTRKPALRAIPAPPTPVPFALGAVLAIAARALSDRPFFLPRARTQSRIMPRHSGCRDS